MPASPPAPPAGSDAVPTTSVDLSRAAGDNTTFHETATERQKFQVHIDFGKIFDARGNLDRAVQEYQDASRSPRPGDAASSPRPIEALAHRRIASALDRLGRFPQAEEHYKKALKLSPKDARSGTTRATAIISRDAGTDAERALRTAIKLAPDDARVRTNLGMTLAAAGTDRGGPPAPEPQPRATRSATPTSAICWPSTGQFDLARQEYQTALAMRPDLALARRALASSTGRSAGSICRRRPRSRASTRIPAPVDPQVRPASTPAP